jgi:tetratricopeptide (TPR) repeat protein
VAAESASTLQPAASVAASTRQSAVAHGSADDEAALARLGRELTAHAGRWSLFVLLYEHEHKLAAMAPRVASLTPHPRQVVATEAAHGNWLELEQAIGQAAAQGGGQVQVMGLSHWLDPLAPDQRTAERWTAMNMRREAFAHLVATPVLLWLRPIQAQTFAALAPDLWSWRSGVHRFTDLDDADLATQKWPIRHTLQSEGIDNRSADERRSRMAAVRDFLSQAGQADASRLRLDLLDELAELHMSLGELDEALRIRYEEELPVFQQRGDLRSRALTLGKIADVLQARGELDEALRIRREVQLPVYEKLGDQRSRAVTMGKIADVLQARGELDEAVRIRREEELPVYEELGDQRSRAVTMGRIADVLLARGELDEALRIRREAELPVYEKLGDQRERAVTMGKIADVLQARGELDEALRIRREEELPVYEKLGDQRSRVVTMGQIADILQARGQLDEARDLHAQRLEVAVAMGDIDSQAHALYSIAQIRLQRGEHQQPEGLQAIQSQLLQALGFGRRLGRPDFIGAIGSLLAQVMAFGGQAEAALAVLDEAEAAWKTLGWATAQEAQVRALRGTIAAQRPQSQT